MKTTFLGSARGGTHSDCVRNKKKKRDIPRRKGLDGRTWCTRRTESSGGGTWTAVRRTRTSWTALGRTPAASAWSSSPAAFWTDGRPRWRCCHCYCCCCCCRWRRFWSGCRPEVRSSLWNGAWATVSETFPGPFLGIGFHLRQPVSNVINSCRVIFLC